MILPEQLRATVAKLDGDRVEFEADALARDAAALVTLLAAVVTRSGYEWRPSLLPSGRRARKPAML